MMKKQRKKSRGSTKTGLAMDKELKVNVGVRVYSYTISPQDAEGFLSHSPK